MRLLYLLPVLLYCSASLAQTYQRYQLIKLTGLSSPYNDGAPVISPDGKKLYFFVVDHPNNTHGKTGTEDIWMSTRDDKGTWTAPQHLGSPFNQTKSSQVFQVFTDGSLLVRGYKSKTALCFSMVSPSGSWTELDVKDFATIARGRFNGATMSADKKHMILYFSETSQGVKSDLYVTHDQGGNWTRPEKLKISTSNDEFAPFISPDGKTMYFASDKPDPMRQGGADIYKSDRLDDTWANWSAPVNMGKPINTLAADFYVSIDAAGTMYTARANSKIDGGNLDIFSLVPKTIHVHVAGTVFDAKTNQPLAASVNVTVKDGKPISLAAPATGKYQTLIPETESYVVSATAPGYQPMEVNQTIPHLNNDTTLVTDLLLTPVAKKLIIAGNVYNKKTNELLTARVDFTLRPEKSNAFTLTAEGGKFEQEVSKLGWYVLTGSANGFLNGTDSVGFNSDDLSPISKDLYLAPIEVGLTVRLKNIYFDFNKTTLKSESFVELDKVVDFLQRNSTVEVEIAGHTDSKGSDIYNQTLSQGRSQSVVDYIVNQGIASARLTAHGYGEAKPVDANDTAEGQANNRRVEFTVLKK